VTAPPIAFIWKAGAFHPLGRARALAASHYGEGEIVELAPVEERSARSHDHQFAWLKTAWLSLPERIAEDFPTPDHLRKRALILAGFYHETIVDAGSNAAALRVAAFMRGDDEFAHVVVRGPLVVRRRAKSQSRRTMDKVEFQASKTGVMAIVADMLGVPAETLEKAA